MENGNKSEWLKKRLDEATPGKSNAASDYSGPGENRPKHHGKPVKPR